MSETSVVPPAGSLASAATTGEAPAESWPSWRADLLAALACALIGMALSALPYLAWWPEFGGPTYIADHDDTLYMSVHAQAYYNHPTRLGDPMFVTPGDTQYPWLQFVPATLLAKALGLGPPAAMLFWRIWAGLSLGLGFYLIVRVFVSRPWVAAGLALFLVSDRGMMSARPFFMTVVLLADMVRGRFVSYFATKPIINTQWRVLSPSVNLFALLLALALLYRARKRPTLPRIVLAGLAFGLLFHVYFYYWTAFGLGLVLAFLIDRGHRRVHFHVGWIGGLIGLPALIAGFRLKQAGSSDWLARTDNFLKIAHFSEFLIPRPALAIAFLGLLAITWGRRRDLIPLWCVALGGLLWQNHQVVTGLQIQNFHWVLVWGPCLSLLLVLLVWGLLEPQLARRRWLGPALVAVVLVQLILSFALRWVEATRTRETRELHAAYHAFLAQRKASDAPQLEPNAVLAGDPTYVELAVATENLRPLSHYIAEFSNRISDDELDQRKGLNAFLIRQDRAAFEKVERSKTEQGWGWWLRDPVQLERKIDRLLAAYDTAARDPVPLMERFHVRYLVLPSGTSPPRCPPLDWRILQRGERWDLWEVRGGPVERSAP